MLAFYFKFYRVKFYIMAASFSNLPGRHERHYRRRIDNPLFSLSIIFNDDDFFEAQRLDHEEILSFIEKFRSIMQQAGDLKPSVDSEVILKLKEDLERLYEISAGLADDQRQNQQAIKQMIGIIMGTIITNSTGDSLAEEELQMESEARSMHFKMLEVPLVADLLHPLSLIDSDELVATLLTEPIDSLEVALQIFDLEQRKEIFSQAQALLDSVDPNKEKRDAWDSLTILKNSVNE
tara:strand:- start:2040 stop:2747 length:708 start_codon:yes stop_codon:yes gene_type:complete